MYSTLLQKDRVQFLTKFRNLCVGYNNLKGENRVSLRLWVVVSECKISIWSLISLNSETLFILYCIFISLCFDYLCQEREDKVKLHLVKHPIFQSIYLAILFFNSRIFNNNVHIYANKAPFRVMHDNIICFKILLSLEKINHFYVFYLPLLFLVTSHIRCSRQCRLNVC